MPWWNYDKEEFQEVEEKEEEFDWTDFVEHEWEPQDFEEEVYEDGINPWKRKVDKMEDLLWWEYMYTGWED